MKEPGRQIRRFSTVFRKVETLLKKLLKLDKIKDEFLANTSHELRTLFENDDPLLYRR